MTARARPAAANITFGSGMTSRRREELEEAITTALATSGPWTVDVRTRLLYETPTQGYGRCGLL